MYVNIPVRYDHEQALLAKYSSSLRNITETVWEARLRWYGARYRAKKNKRRPKKRRIGYDNEDLKVKDLTGDMAKNRKGYIELESEHQTLV